MYQNNLKPATPELIDLIREHQQTKKNFEIQDAYKLIYQSVYGIGHILSEPALARQALVREFDSIAPSDAEQLIERISPSGDMVRLNLRPYKSRDGNIDLLFQAMLRSATATPGSPEKFLVWWNQFKHAVFEGTLNFDKEDLKIFDNELQLSNYPVVHHSLAYRESNHPAYRVLIGHIASQLA